MTQCVIVFAGLTRSVVRSMYMTYSSEACNGIGNDDKIMRIVHDELIGCHFRAVMY